MRSHSQVYLRIVASTLFALGMAGGVVVPAQADQWDKRTILTVNEPIQIQERLLPPGQYVLKLLNSSSDRHVVQIFNAEQSHIIDTVLAIPNYRLQPTGKSQFLFWETPPGNAKALRAWFYPGDNFGQEFRYPKHLQVLEASVSKTVITQAPSTVTLEQPAAVTQPETPVTQPAQTEPMSQEANREEPVEVAQATPPPAQAPPPPAPPTQEQPPQSLPKTATLYPLIGLCGILSLSLYGLLRLRRTS